ncbi:hypothetical protein BC830DRAFT_1116995 [Chytriomyces sp. MP71]|nr:hypothetical protein BC830DRAFT_1116995 [Chytriomyces sp. MP71]
MSSKSRRQRREDYDDYEQEEDVSQSNSKSGRSARSTRKERSERSDYDEPPRSATSRSNTSRRERTDDSDEPKPPSYRSNRRADYDEAPQLSRKASSQRRAADTLDDEYSTRGLGSRRNRDMDREYDYEEAAGSGSGNRGGRKGAAADSFEDEHTGQLNSYDMKNMDTYMQDLDEPGYGNPNDYAYDGYYDLEKGKRKRCYCIPASKKGQIICGVSVTLTVIVFAIFLYFFIPRYPEIKVLSINLKNFDTGAFTFVTPNNNGNLNAMSFALSLTMNVSTFNPNLYGLTVDRIDLTAQMMVNSSYIGNPRLVSNLATNFGSLTSLVTKSGAPPLAGQVPSGYTPPTDSQIGTGLVQGITFPSKTWVNYTMVFNLNYTANAYLGILKDPTVQEIADCCGITSRYSPPGRPMKIHYDAATTISALKPFGYTPGVSNDIMIACPISPDQINAVIQAVENGSDPVAALKQVLSSPQ